MSDLRVRRTVALRLVDASSMVRAPGALPLRELTRPPNEVDRAASPASLAFTGLTSRSTSAEVSRYSSPRPADTRSRPRRTDAGGS